jgi:predicted Zn-ribbon and HTH transcriptional regulator
MRLVCDLCRKSETEERATISALVRAATDCGWSVRRQNLKNDVCPDCRAQEVCDG